MAAHIYRGTVLVEQGAMADIDVDDIIARLLEGSSPPLPYRLTPIHLCTLDPHQRPFIPPRRFRSPSNALWAPTHPPTHRRPVHNVLAPMSCTTTL